MIRSHPKFMSTTSYTQLWFAMCNVLALQVIDFGSSCFISDALSTYIQSRSYRAPEVSISAKEVVKGLRSDARELLLWEDASSSMRNDALTFICA